MSQDAKNAKGAKNTLRAFVCAVLALSLTMPPGFTPPQAQAEELPETAAVAVSAEGSYAAYMAEHGGKGHASAVITLNGGDYYDADMDITKLEDWEGRSGASILTEEDGYVEWEFTVAEAGLYNIMCTYYNIQGKGSSIERTFLIDGVLPYKEAEYVSLNRMWKDVIKNAAVDVYGNDIRPEQEEVNQWISAPFRDPSGNEQKPLCVYLDKGKHTFRLISDREPVVIGEITFFHNVESPQYSEVLSSYQKNGYTAAPGNIVYIQAEDLKLKTDKANYPINDRSSAATVPQDAYLIKLNSLDGSKWQNVGSTVYWDFTPESTGLYKIALRNRQDIYSGTYASRKLTINGEAPFKEAESIEFDYNTDWTCDFIGESDGNDGYLFYFEAGKTYRIGLEAVMGRMGDLLARVSASVVKLNEMYRTILMITGSTPDGNRDYGFKTQIPNVIAEMKVQADELRSVSDEITRQSSGNGERTVQLDKIVFLLDLMYERPSQIAKKFTNFKDNIAGLGTWIIDTAKQPLDLDYIAVVPDGVQKPKANAGFFENISFAVNSFIASFVIDYKNIGSTRLFTENDKRVTVWIASGRDQSQIIRQLIDSTFTPNTGINVDLQLVAGGTLLPSILANQGPDVSLSNGGGDPVNYAVRNAVADLSGFPNFDEVASRFHPSAMVPYTFDNQVFALPETQSFPMMFYRTDIFADMGLTPPSTWKEFNEIIQELQKQNLSIGLPHDLNMLLTFMYQNDTPLYLNEGATVNLDSKEAIRAFTRLTEYYTLYKFPTEYDFANRFRTGEMPLAIADYMTYNQLTIFAPEIRGLWTMTSIPGNIKADGSIDASNVTTGSSVMMMKSSKMKDDAWAFMDWWTSADVQAGFGTGMESILGASAKYATANLEALSMLPWKVSDYKNIEAQWEHVKGVPEVPGGYYTGRAFTFAFNRVINSYKNVKVNGIYDAIDPGDIMQDYIIPINSELTRKRAEFGIE